MGRLPQPVEQIPHFARVAHIDRIALQTFGSFADVHPAHAAGHHRLHVGDVEAMAGRPLALDGHVDVAATGQAFGEGTGDPGHLLDRLLDLARQPVDDRKVAAQHLDPDRALDPGGQHVQAVADGRNPDVGQSGDAHGLVEFIDDAFGRHTGQ